MSVNVPWNAGEAALIAIFGGARNKEIKKFSAAWQDETNFWYQEFVPLMKRILLQERDNKFLVYFKKK